MNVSQQVSLLSDRIHELAKDETREGRRILVGIAGAPGSGKSTLSSELVRILNLQKLRSAIVPMDGFHLDNRVLDDLGLRSRKGSPESFDAAGFLHMMRRVKAGEEVFAPIFDRPRDIAIAGAQAVSSDTRVVVCEGNYLLLDEPPWNALHELWDISAWIEVALPELRARLIHRWLSHGFSRTVATQRTEQNDLRNVRRCLDARLPADFELVQSG